MAKATVGGFTNVPEKLLQGARRGILAGTEELRNEVVSLVTNTAKTGRVYGKHRASAPGEPFASDTGEALRQITTEYADSGLTGYVNSAVEYGAALEFGTEKMEARPYMRPALQNKKAEIEAIVRAELTKALK